jgi:MFS family permease
MVEAQGRSPSGSRAAYVQHNNIVPNIVAAEDEEQRIENTRLEKTIISVSSVPELSTTEYSQRELWFIVGVSTMATFASSASVAIYLPAFEQLEEEFHVDTEKMNLTVTVYSIFQGLSPILWGTLSDAIGRRPVYIMCFVIYISACMGLALAQSYWTLFSLRMVQAIGIASMVAIMSGVVTDVTSRRNRGSFMGFASGFGMIGNVFGPLIGGGISGGMGWRVIFWFLVIVAGFILVVILVLLPETNRFIAGDGSYYPRQIINRSPYAFFRNRIMGVPFQKGDDGYEGAAPPPRPPLDVFSAIRLLKELDVILVLIPNALHYATCFMILTTLASVLSEEYEFSSTEIGLAYLASGFGGMIGSLSSGRLMSYLYKREVKRFKQSCIAQGKEIHMSELNIQKVRLSALIYPSFASAVAAIVYGWTIQKHVTFWVPILSTSFATFASTYFVCTTNTLLSDLFPGKSASACAVINGSRCLVSAVGLAAVDEMIIAVGAGGTFTLMGAISLASMALIHAEIKLGRGIHKKRLLREDYNHHRS